MPTAGVEFAKVSYTPAGGPSVLHDISLKLQPGTTTALLGRSGSGKTTLLRTVNGLVRPSSGRITTGSIEVTALVSEEQLVALRRTIGYVIQETGLFPHMTLERNVALSLELTGWSRQRSATRAAEVIAQVGLGNELRDRYPWQLSGGQRQRAGVARALLLDPEVLLMDEPFGALDPLTRAEMQHMMNDLLRGSGRTALIITHDLNEALKLADRVVFLDEGRVVADLAVEDVLAAENPLVRQYVVASSREAR